MSEIDSDDDCSLTRARRRRRLPPGAFVQVPKPVPGVLLRDVYYHGFTQNAHLPFASSEPLIESGSKIRTKSNAAYDRATLVTPLGAAAVHQKDQRPMPNHNGTVITCTNLSCMGIGRKAPSLLMGSRNPNPLVNSRYRLRNHHVRPSNPTLQVAKRVHVHVLARCRRTAPMILTKCSSSYSFSRRDMAICTFLSNLQLLTVRSLANGLVKCVEHIGASNGK